MTEMFMNRGSAALADGVRIISGVVEQPREVKVAAYCRVSTDMEIQQRSLDIQIEAFNKIIREHPGWELAGIYVDKGISGTQVLHREEFKRMIEDAKAGKIQYILAKSISRFARNTVDVLTYVRELKECGVSVFFEKEKLDTGSAKSELVLSIYAANAQEEIVSLSNNMKVGRRMRAAAGIPQWTPLYGYCRNEDGEWVIEESEAETVRRVFREYVEGSSLPEIVKHLERDGVSMARKGTEWTPTALSQMMHNERYMGDIRMQKYFVSDPITHTLVNNRDARLKQYYKENNHPAIVSREEFQLAQRIMAMKDQTRGTIQYPFYGILKCPLCGANMVRFNMTRSNHAFGWTCGGQKSPDGDLRKNRTACPPFYFVETYIVNGFWESMRKLDRGQLQEIASGRKSEKKEAAEEILRLMPGGSQQYPRLEYIMLCRLVKKISFPQWDIMRINWKCGLVSETKMEFGKASDLPLPTIEKKMMEHVTKLGSSVKETYVINGEPLIKGCPNRQVAGILNSQEAVLNLVILEPKAYEADVPCVYGRSSISVNKVKAGDANDSPENCPKDRGQESGSLCAGQHAV